MSQDHPLGWDPTLAAELAPGLLDLSPADQVQKAYGAALTAGYRAGSASGNPTGFLIDLYTNVVAPCALDHLPAYQAALGDTLRAMREERFSGPRSQEVYVAVAIADALAKTLMAAADQNLAWNTLSATDWLALAIGFYMWLQAQPGLAALKEPIHS